MSFTGFVSAKYDNNATTLNGIAANRYMVYLTTNDENILNANYKYCYVANVSATFATEQMGLPTCNNPWYQILYICHQNGNGYGMQLAFQFADNEYVGVIFQRKANGTTWDKWYKHTGTAL